MEPIKVCVDKWIPLEASLHLAEKANGLNVKTMAVAHSKRWLPGYSLQVRFLNGSATQQAKVQEHAKKWMDYANVKFVFNNSPNAEVRIAFYDGVNFTDQGSWSYVGTDALHIANNQPTMNFGWLNDDTSDSEYERVAVHEFGHALGCLHEDQSPGEHIQWNKEAVYGYYTGPPNNWTREDVDLQILNPTSADGVDYTAFDSVSIMAYSIPPEFTTDGVGVPGGTTLSAQDRLFISSEYPSQNPPPLPSDVLHADGVPHNYSAVAGHVEAVQLVVSKPGRLRIWTTSPHAEIAVYAKGAVKPGIKGNDVVTASVKPGIFRVVVTDHAAGNFSLFARM